MPFGNSKKEKKEKKGYAVTSYPTASYPVASYPTAPPVGGYQAQYTPPQQMGAVGGQPFPPQQGYPQTYPMQAPPPTNNQAPPPYTANYQPGQPPMAPPMGATVVVQNGFDAGARFSHGSVALPPPPPGVMPNAAQMAAAQGHNVVVTQKKGDVWTGGSDGGYCIW